MRKKYRYDEGGLLDILTPPLTSDERARQNMARDRRRDSARFTSLHQEIPAPGTVNTPDQEEARRREREESRERSLREHLADPIHREELHKPRDSHRMDIIKAFTLPPERRDDPDYSTSERIFDRTAGIGFGLPFSVSAALADILAEKLGETSQWTMRSFNDPSLTTDREYMAHIAGMPGRGITSLIGKSASEKGRQGVERGRDLLRNLFSRRRGRDEEIYGPPEIGRASGGLIPGYQSGGHLGVLEAFLTNQQQEEMPATDWPLRRGWKVSGGRTGREQLARDAALTEEMMAFPQMEPPNDEPEEGPDRTRLERYMETLGVRGRDMMDSGIGALGKGVGGLRRLWNALQKRELDKEKVLMGSLSRASGGLIPGYQFGGLTGGTGGGGWGGGGGGGQWGNNEPFRAPLPTAGSPQAPGGGGWGAGGGGGQSLSAPISDSGFGKTFGGPPPVGFGGGPQSGRPPQPQWGGGGGMQQPQWGGSGQRQIQWAPGGGPTGSTQAWNQRPGAPGAQPPGGQPSPPILDGGGGGAQPPATPPPTGPTAYQPPALPQNYGAPGAFPKYGSPESFSYRQEIVDPQVAGTWAHIASAIPQIGTRPFEQYQGPTIAGPTSDELSAQAQTRAIAMGPGEAGTIQGQATLGQAGQGLGTLLPRQTQLGREMQQLGARGEFQGQLAGAGMRQTGQEAQLAGGQAAQEMRGIGAQAGDPDMLRGANLQDYMSQYSKGVTDPQLEALHQFTQAQQAQTASQAAQQGVGGSALRLGVQQAQHQMGAAQQAADIIGQQRQKSFESAQQAFEADRAAKAAGLGQQLTAAGQAEQAAGRGYQLGLQGQQQGFGAAQAGTEMGFRGLQGAQGAMGAQANILSQIGQVGRGQLAGGEQARRQQTAALESQRQHGERQRAFQQAALSEQQRRWQERQDAPTRRLQETMSMMRQLPYQNIVSQGTFVEQPGPKSQKIGEGIAGVGLWNQWNQQPGAQRETPAWQQPWQPAPVGGGQDVFGRTQTPPYMPTRTDHVPPQTYTPNPNWPTL